MLSLFVLTALIALTPNVVFAACPNGGVGLGIEADCQIGNPTGGGCTSIIS